METRSGYGLSGPFGPPYLAAYAGRDFPLQQTQYNNCPGLFNLAGYQYPFTSAQAYSVNYTAVPRVIPLDFLSVWPAGQPYPNVSTLNSFDGSAIANSAITVAGSPSGGITVVAGHDTDFIVDINGYFAPPGTGGLYFYPVSPCRVPNTSPASPAVITIPIAGACGIPGTSTAQAYSIRATAVQGANGDFLSIWPYGQNYPGVSTVNTNGNEMANAALIPSGTAGAINVYAPTNTNVFIDVNGFFSSSATVQPLSVTCSASPNPATVGQTVWFTATSNGVSASYSWSGAVSGAGQSVQFQPSAADYPYTATVTVTDGQNTASGSCSVAVTNPGQSLSSQARADNTNVAYYLGYPATRQDGNHVRLYAETVPTGSNSRCIEAYIQTWLYRDGTLLDSTPMTSPQIGGTTASKTWTPTLEVNGPGTYSMTAWHKAYNWCTAQWAGCTGSCVDGYTGATQSDPPLTINRPTRPDYLSPYPTSLWFLGFGITGDGAYSSTTVFKPGAPSGAPESPVYFVTAGSNKLSLNCTNCTNPTVTAIGASGGCTTYDVVVKTGYGSATLGYFYSDPFYIFINRPWNTVAASDQAAPGWCGVNNGPWAQSCANGNGWETHVNYNVESLCGLDPPMTTYDLNEHFGGDYAPDYTGENWGWSVTEGNVSVSSSDPIWYDVIRISTPNSVAGDPEYCTGTPGVLCVPTFTNPGDGPHIAVDHMTTQSWFAGSLTNGVGARIQTNTLQRYTDSGFHTNVVTPKP